MSAVSRPWMSDLALASARIIHLVDDGGHDHRGQQADDDDDHHDLNERKAAAGRPRIVSRASVNLVSVL